MKKLLMGAAIALMTKQLIPCSDHGDAVIENPNAFGIDLIGSW